MMQYNSVRTNFLTLIGCLFLGMILFTSCGNDAKNKSKSNSSDTSSESAASDSKGISNSDSSVVSSTKEKTDLVKEEPVAEMEEVEEVSFNPPHIPVFNKKKKKAKKKPKSDKKKPVVKEKIEAAPLAKETEKIASEKIDVRKEVKPASVPKKKEVKVVSGKDTEIVWRRNFYSFGDITQGDTVYFKFEYTNIGEHPLVIESATASCDCTHPSFTFIPIDPNSKGEITGMYVSDTKKGTQNAMIQVVANTEPSIHKLYIDGNVLLPEGNTKAGEEESKGN